MRDGIHTCSMARSLLHLRHTERQISLVSLLPSLWEWYSPAETGAEVLLGYATILNKEHDISRGWCLIQSQIDWCGILEEHPCRNSSPWRHEYLRLAAYKNVDQPYLSTGVA